MNRSSKDGRAIKLVHISDSHMSPQSPPSWKIDYVEHTDQTLRQVFEFAIKNQVDAVIWSGDIFHRKAPASNPLRFMSHVIREMRMVEDAGIENWGVGGNHDLKWGSLEGLTGQPLENLIAAKVYRLLDYEELLVEGDGFSVRVAGGSYEHGKAEHVRAKKKSGATYLVSVGHFWFGPETGTMFGEPAFGPDYLGQGEPDVYCIGHHHDDQGIQQVAGKWYVAHGSINRTGGREADLIRRPAAALLTFTKEKIEIKVLRPRVRPAEEVIDLQVRSQIMEEKKEMEKFIESLHGAKIEAVDPTEILAELDAAVEVKERAQLYLAEAEEALK